MGGSGGGRRRSDRRCADGSPLVCRVRVQRKRRVSGDRRSSALRRRSHLGFRRTLRRRRRLISRGGRIARGPHRCRSRRSGRRHRWRRRRSGCHRLIGAHAGLIGVNGDGVDFLRLAREDTAAGRRLRRDGALQRRGHRIGRIGLNPDRFYFDRLFFARHQFFVLGVIGDTVVNQLVGRFARGCRHDLARRGIGFDHGRRARRPRTAENRAITEGAGGSDHRQGKDGGDGHDAHAPFRRMTILIVALFLGSSCALPG